MNEYLEVLKKYTDFNGRARRKEYWMFTLISTVISVVFGIVCGLIKMPMLANVYSIAVLLPTIAVAIRRMHDVGKSGWYCLIPIYNLVLACTDSEHGTNEYGTSPKYGGDEISEIGRSQE
jgi:uncharacterized membrane protein YhaH (DUF805 family)